jgi:uncharacterized protein (TIGR02266 family)
MTQDTRKDRRVKIVSLNVRYKSATVDEFIENHAHDVSRGGIYIKTATPFPQGTLLKFEIRLASDQTVITGVGRVVWKREAAEGEQPAGMGVKFIKVDDSSKVVIDRLVTSKSDAGKAFESEPDPTAHARPSAPAEAVGPPSSPPGSKRKVTPYKVASLGPPGLSGGPPPIPRPGASSGSPSSAPRPVAPSPLFPKSTSVAPDGPKPEQTVMKQAAELLEEALREAGGSMEEVGTNPLFSGDLPASDAKGAGAPPAPMGSTSAAPPSNRSKAPSKAADEGAAARGMVAALSPGQVTAKSGTGELPRKPAVSTSIPAPRKSGTRLGLILGAMGVVAILGLVLNKDRLFGSGPEPAAPSAAPSQPSPSVAASAAVEAPAPSASAAPAPSAEPSSQPSPPAASASAGSKPVTAAPPASAAPQATKPTVVAQAPATATAQAPSAPATAAPDSSSGAPSAASAAPRAPKPAAPPAVKAPPKAGKPSDNDNPY